jgi:hypothetical protein
MHIVEGVAICQAKLRRNRRRKDRYDDVIVVNVLSEELQLRLLREQRSNNDARSDGTVDERVSVVSLTIYTFKCCTHGQDYLESNGMPGLSLQALSWLELSSR